ncbi:MAG TPA: hypothetical protein EYN66_13490 [Myxococcales bacterium]|nr:hypothetical protein [Myxococcales bacterium]
MRTLAKFVIAVAIVPLAIANCGPSGASGNSKQSDSAGTTTGEATGGSTDEGRTERKPGQTCAPNSVKCFGAAVLTCKTDGSDWSKTTTCGNGQICDADSGGCRCDPQCGVKVCGADACGGSCGDCPINAACTTAGTCQAPTECIAAGTGIMPGQKAKNVSWTDENGSKFELHSLCGTAKATLAVEVAAW